MVIYLMRHTAVDVPQGVCYGQTDVPLKPTFETEATQTAANLQGLSFDKVYMHVKATNGESFEDQYRRVAGFLDELRQKPYEQVAIFAHGGILLNAQIYAGIIKPEEAFSALTPYGGIVKIKLS